MQRKKFEIRAVGCPESRKFTYYTSSDDKSKHLLYLCRVTHQFSMAMQPKLAELRKLEEEGTIIDLAANSATKYLSMPSSGHSIPKLELLAENYLKQRN